MGADVELGEYASAAVNVCCCDGHAAVTVSMRMSNEQCYEGQYGQ